MQETCKGTEILNYRVIAKDMKLKCRLFACAMRERKVMLCLI